MKLTEKELYAQLDELIARYPILKGVGGGYYGELFDPAEYI